ncbi:MAG: hypothetical protein LBQ47_01910, partial [Endomicrobium sp.]|nr:hypothetical protein [Endomicrobium sp.]
ISKALEDICFGIRDAQKTMREKIDNFPIAPAFMDGKSVIKDNNISFDISISIQSSETVNKEGEAKTAKIVVIGGSINKEIANAII